MSVLIALAAALAGVLNTVQAGANTTLSRALDQPIAAALVVSAVNAVVYLAVGLVVGAGWPGGQRIAAAPWWAWLGGLMGAAYVLAVIYLAQRLGAAVFTGITVTAAILTSTALDHFGWVGFAQHSAGPWRILGCVLMIGGLSLVSLF
jgi:bacterial/archaeal transporter family-2 protein